MYICLITKPTQKQFHKYFINAGSLQLSTLRNNVCHVCHPEAPSTAWEDNYPHERKLCFKASQISAKQDWGTCPTLKQKLQGTKPYPWRVHTWMFECSYINTENILTCFGKLILNLTAYTYTILSSMISYWATRCFLIKYTLYRARSYPSYY